MRDFKGKSYIEIEHKKYIIRPLENVILREGEKARSLTTQYQILDEKKR